MLSIPFNSNSLDNIYAISLKTGEVIWRVASCDKWKNPLPYENMSQISDDQFVATDFYARKVVIDVKTGKVIETGISKWFLIIASGYSRPEASKNALAYFPLRTFLPFDDNWW